MDGGFDYTVARRFADISQRVQHADDLHEICVATCKIQPWGAQVSIDSGPLQPVVYGGDVRTDIAGAFTGLSNSTAAGGHYIFDWTTLTTGPHTIGWLITDDCNRADRAGSRFFNVSTGTSLTAVAPAASVVAEALTESPDPITVARGYGELPEIVTPGQAWSRIVEVQQGGGSRSGSPAASSRRISSSPTVGDGRCRRARPGTGRVERSIGNPPPRTWAASGSCSPTAARESASASWSCRKRFQDFGTTSRLQTPISDGHARRGQTQLVAQDADPITVACGSSDLAARPSWPSS